MIEFIAEFCQTDSLEEALAQVAAARTMGATHAKWQIVRPDRLTGPTATRYWNESLGGPEDQGEMFSDFGCLNESEWRNVAKACERAGVEFMATPFDLEAVDLLEDLGVAAFKIASGDLTYKPLIEKIAATGKRVYLSTGAASLQEITRALLWLKGSDVVAMACDLVYPCRPQDSSMAQQLRNLRKGPFSNALVHGYSDHTMEVVTGAVAVSLGATVLEKHVTLDPGRGRPDDLMALNVSEAQQYVEMARDAALLVAPVEGDPQAPARIGARRSAHAAHDLLQGHTLKDEDISWLRPAPQDSINPAQAIAGRKLNRPVKAGERITLNDLA